MKLVKKVNPSNLDVSMGTEKLWLIKIFNWYLYVFKFSKDAWIKHGQKYMVFSDSINACPFMIDFSRHHQKRAKRTWNK